VELLNQVALKRRKNSTDMVEEAQRERYLGVRRSTAKGIRAFCDLCGERRDLGFYIG